MIRLRKISLLNPIRKSRSPLYYWSLGAGFLTTTVLLTTGYFAQSYRNKLRTKEAIRTGDPDNIIAPQGLSSQELEKAITIFEQRNAHEKIQAENFERYKQLRSQRREQQGLG